MLDDHLAMLRRHLAGPASARTIDAALRPIAAARDPRSIAPLLLMLNDAHDDDGMWSILHAAEDFADADYVPALLAASPGLVAASPQWASIILIRVLNADATRTELVRRLAAAPPDQRDAVAGWCDTLRRTDARFAAASGAVRRAAQDAPEAQ